MSSVNKIFVFFTNLFLSSSGMGGGPGNNMGGGNMGGGNMGGPNNGGGNFGGNNSGGGGDDKNTTQVTIPKDVSCCCESERSRMAR